MTNGVGNSAAPAFYGTVEGLDAAIDRLLAQRQPPQVEIVSPAAASGLDAAVDRLIVRHQEAVPDDRSDYPSSQAAKPAAGLDAAIDRMLQRAP